MKALALCALIFALIVAISLAGCVTLEQQTQYGTLRIDFRK
jgi:uncharacterized lipoprotein YehR (DUF1307 family)